MTAPRPKRPTAKRPAKQAPKQKGARLAKPAQDHGPDLVAIELTFRTTNATLEAIGRQHGLSKGRISQLATEHGWTRDLQATVRARADAKVQAQEAHDAQVEAGTDAAVDHSAVIMANTILRERKDVLRMLQLAEGLCSELEGEVAKAKAKPVKGAKKVKVSPLAVRIDNLRKLADTAKTLIVLERHIQNITPDTPIDPGKRVAEAVDNGFAGLKAAFEKKLGRA